MDTYTPELAKFEEELFDLGTGFDNDLMKVLAFLLYEAKTDLDDETRQLAEIQASGLLMGLYEKCKDHGCKENFSKLINHIENGYGISFGLTFLYCC